VTDSKFKNSLSSTDIVDQYFLEHRAKLIDIAAFLDRLQRADDGKAEDFRMKAFNKAAEVLTDKQPDKARRILEIFSDHTTDLADSAPESKAASGAPKELQ